jgi:uncharacterized protein (TIGR02598 family)
MLNAKNKFDATMKKTKPFLKRGFSLVEVTLAVGVLSFALVALFGMLPVGLQVFREAVDTTAQNQIMQKLTTLAEQTEFTKLDGAVATKVSSAADRETASAKFYYFNDQGEEVFDEKDAVYTAGLTYTASTNLPNAAKTIVSQSIATLWVDIYNNKGNFLDGKPVDPKRKTIVIHIADFGKRI